MLGAWNFTAGAGFFLLVILMNHTPVLEALPKGNSSHGLRRKLFPDIRQIVSEGTQDEGKIIGAFSECTDKWLAVVGEKCREDRAAIGMDLRNIDENYKGDAFGKEFKKIYIHLCQNHLDCTEGNCTCILHSDNSSSCDPPIPVQNLNQECEAESKAYVTYVRRIKNPDLIKNTEIPTPSSVSDQGQHFLYVILMAVIVFVAAN